MSLGKCVIDGAPASVVYPLLPGSPAFCHKHHNSRDAGPFGADFSGPDDFDIPDWDDSPLVFRPPYDPKTKLWTDQYGIASPFSALSSSHLENIRNWIVRTSQNARWGLVVGVDKALEAVDRELQRRRDD